MADHGDEHDEIICHEFVEIVTDYLEGALPEDRRDLVEEHLVLCDSCQNYLDQVQTTVRMLPDAVRDEPVPTESRDALLGMFRDWKEQR
jgi:predicted anti-sigma-YlaC factor YlaD